MGGVWCKADKGQARTYSTKGTFNSTISRWTDHVRQAYRKPKTQHTPPRPPQKPIWSSERLTISHPQLPKDASSDGWRTATLLVPEAVPVPPPRKKRKRNQELKRAAFSMDDLNRVEPLNKSTISLPDKCLSENELDSRSSSTVVVTPILESRLEHSIEETEDRQEDNKENIILAIENKVEEEDEDDTDCTDHPEEIIPIEKETLFSSRTILHSNLGYIDKLSAISEVSAESGFEDRMDVLKSSDRSESVTSSESLPRETGLNILAHIHNLNNVSYVTTDVKEKTAVSKKEWLQNILEQEQEPYFISRDIYSDYRRGSDNVTLGAKVIETPEQPSSLPTDHLNIMNRETNECEENGNKLSPLPYEIPSKLGSENSTNHSVLLEILQKNPFEEKEQISLNPLFHKEEKIFLTNTKTNIIYKSLSSDKLTDDYDSNYLAKVENDAVQCHSSSIKSNEDEFKPASIKEKNFSNQFSSVTSKTHLSDYSFQTPKLVESDTGANSLSGDKESNVVSFEFRDLKQSQNYMTVLKELQSSRDKPQDENLQNVLVNGVDSHSSVGSSSDTRIEESENKTSDKLCAKESGVIRDSLTSSRRSSITDSLHEFEMSIYDMLKESKKNRDSSDEDESLKIVKTENKQQT